MGERIIKLDEINLTEKRPDEALGISDEEIKSCMKQINAEHKTYGGILIELSLNKSEVKQVLKQPSVGNKVSISSAVVLLWQKKNRKIITLRDYVGTAMIQIGIIHEDKK